MQNIWQLTHIPSELSKFSLFERTSLYEPFSTE